MVVAPDFPMFGVLRADTGYDFTNTHGGDAHTTHNPARLIKSYDYPKLRLWPAALLLDETNELSFVHDPVNVGASRNKKKWKGRDVPFAYN